MTQDAALKILRDVRDLLTDPAHWTQKEWARNADGGARLADEPSAVCWCLGGAFWKCTGDEGFAESEEPWHDDVRAAWDRLVIVIDGEHAGSVYKFNDESTHAEVLDLLDRAIEEAA